MKKAIITIFLFACFTLTATNRDGVECILGYLCVFPSELGYYNEVPMSIINSVNEQSLYGYGTWRLPTKEELELLKANGYLEKELKYDDHYEYKIYMSQERKQGNVLLVASKKENNIAAQKAQANSRLNAIKNQSGFIDLGLPSGTLWKANNIGDWWLCKFQDENSVLRLEYEYVPTKNQWRELLTQCTWEKVKEGVIATGKNGNSIFFPYNGWGYIGNSKKAQYKGELGAYWTITDEGASDGGAWGVMFSPSMYEFGESAFGQYYKTDHLSIRTVRPKE